MNSSLFDFELPPERIAQVPTARREESRLMLIDRESRVVSHHLFRDLPELLPAKCQLFRNNATVLKARLYGERPSGGRVECLLVQPSDQLNEWWCLVRPGKKVLRDCFFGLPGVFKAEVLETGEGGSYRVRFDLEEGETVEGLANRIGQMPLPPYIARSGDDPRTHLDAERYQTVYADPARCVAAAAPTAGLHFTPEVIAETERRGHVFHDLTLHVGLGTFQPIKTATIAEHRIHREVYELPRETFTAFRSPAGGRRLAVGTTAVRTMEHAARRFANVAPTDLPPVITDEADIFIYPPAQFKAVDALLTNFHLPRSTLLCLVSGFLAPNSMDGIEWLLEIYALAIAEQYRFFSYGDCMLIL